MNICGGGTIERISAGWAWRLAVVLLSVLLLASCVVPEDIRERVDGDDDFELENDYWPVIRNVKPAFGKTTIPRDCRRWTFQILDVNMPEDPDVNLSIRWFLDYDQNAPKIDGVGMTYALPARQVSGSEESPILQHVLEVVVSDKGFVQDQADSDLRTTPADAHTYYGVWFITLDTSLTIPDEEQEAQCQ